MGAGIFFGEDPIDPGVLLPIEDFVILRGLLGPDGILRQDSLVNKTKILVTGGAGLIGSHLIDHLMDNEENVVVALDNFCTGTRNNLEKWSGNSRFALIQHDVVNEWTLPVDQIYHLACPESCWFHTSNLVETAKINFDGTLNVLKFATKCFAKMLLASSSRIYGDALVHPQSEHYWGYVNPVGDHSSYDEGKRLAENRMVAYHNEHGTDIRIASIFDVYGPRMRIGDGMVLTSFVKQAVRYDLLFFNIPKFRFMLITKTFIEGQLT